MLSSYSVAQGHIFWLTKPFEEVYYEDSDDERKGLRETFHGIERGVYGHPVMVLHKVAGTTDAAVCLVSILSYSIPATTMLVADENAVSS